jgi:hypothetical protein
VKGEKGEAQVKVDEERKGEGAKRERKADKD